MCVIWGAPCLLAVSHGYQLNGERDLYDQWWQSGLGSVTSRGELAVEPNPGAGHYGNWAASPHWSLQANAEWGLTFGLGIWNLYAGFLGNATFYPTLDFFNRHAESVDVATTTSAFVSFRDSLDTDDTARFPEATFGTVNVSGEAGLNGARMQLIAEAFKAYGARVDDVNEAKSRKSVVQKKGMFLNDVCWRCWPGNYAKFMDQLNATETSVGYWRVGDVEEPYGRFARGLHQQSGKSAIRLKLQSGFASAHRDVAGLLHTSLRVVYFDNGAGWTLTYPSAGGGRGVAMCINHTGTGRWMDATANITVAAVGESEGGEFDFELRSLRDETDPIFSLIEVMVV